MNRKRCPWITTQKSTTGTSDFIIIFFLFKKGIFGVFFFFCTIFIALPHLPPLRFYCVEGCWDRNHNCCDSGHWQPPWLDLIHKGEWDQAPRITTQKSTTSAFIINITHHAGLGLLPDEGVPEDLSELAGPEGEVGPLATQSSDALLEGEEGLVDLCALHPGLPVGGGCVRAPLVARQINQGEFAEERPLVVVLPQDDLMGENTRRWVTLSGSFNRQVRVTPKIFPASLSKKQKQLRSFNQWWGSVTFWCGSRSAPLTNGSGSDSFL